MPFGSRAVASRARGHPQEPPPLTGEVRGWLARGRFGCPCDGSVRASRAEVRFVSRRAVAEHTGRVEEPGYLADEAGLVRRRRPRLRRCVVGAAALVTAATAGYVAGDADGPSVKERLSRNTLLSCEGLPPVLILQVAGLDADKIVQLALNVGRSEYLITPDRPLLRGLPVDRGLRPDAHGRIEMVRQLDFAPPSGQAEFVVYEAGSLTQVVQRQRVTRVPCTEK